MDCAGSGADCLKDRMLKSLSVTNDNLKEAGHGAPAAEPQVDMLAVGPMLLLQQLPGVLCVLSGPERKVAFTNAGFQQLADCCTLGTPFDDTPMATWPGLADAVRKAFAIGEGTERLRMTVPRMHGEIVLELAVQPIRSGEGGLAAVAIQGTDVTEQVRAEAAMRAIHERAESILDVLGDGFVAFDEDFRVIKINAAALKYDGRQEHEILGITHWEAWPTSKGSVLEEVYLRCLNEQVQISIERQYLGFGRDRWLELRLCPVPGGIVSFYCDITDRKLSDAALRASEERFRALVEAVPHLVWEAGPDGQIEWVNGRFAQYTGIAIEHLQESAWRQVLHPDDYNSVVEAWRRARLDGSIFEREIRLRRRSDDSFRWFLSKGVPVRDAEGEVIRWIGTNTEIHEEKAARRSSRSAISDLEERVEESTRDRERMWRLSTDLMLVTSLDGTILATNPAWRLVLDWSDAELQGISVLDLLHPDSRASAQAEIANILSARGGDKGEFQLRHRDGTYRGSRGRRCRTISSSTRSDVTSRPKKSHRKPCKRPRRRCANRRRWKPSGG